MTESQLHTLRLVGGRYDGDQDEIDAVPPTLWAYGCDCDPACEGINRTHWLWGPDAARQLPTGGHPAEYRYSHPEGTGPATVHVYTCQAITPRHQQDTREVVTA